MQKELLTFERKTLKIKIQTVYFITASKTEHQKQIYIPTLILTFFLFMNYML